MEVTLVIDDRQVVITSITELNDLLSQTRISGSGDLVTSHR